MPELEELSKLPLTKLLLVDLGKDLKIIPTEYLDIKKIYKVGFILEQAFRWLKIGKIKFL